MADIRGSARMTRRNLIAAAGVFGSALLARSAKALADRPGHHWGWRDDDRNGDGGGGDDFGNDPNCFLKGTQVWTPNGEKRIEELVSQDLVVTSSGEGKPVKAIWRQRYERPRRTGWPLDITPIRLAPSSLAPNVPHRDLFLSPGHGLFIDGVLVAAVDLLNNLNITRANVESLDALEYFHVKLDRHNAIYAEGAACETMHSDTGIKSGDLEAYRGFYEEPSFAPILSYRGGRGMFWGRLRSALSPILDVRTRLDVMRDELEKRALSPGS